MSRDLTLGVPQLATPNQAATLFNPSGQHPVRQKHLFVVRFMRETQSNDANWRNGLTFVVKSIDRPAVQATTEEINQYNRKRLIHTGVKYQPVNCTLYDTADGAAMDMWLQYARYYFADYHHEANDYADDILNDEMKDSSDDNGRNLSKRGYGFNIREGAANEGTGSQHFFHKVIVYQLWGNEYTSYELLNPRINTFTPDELSYEAADVSTIQLSLSYEAIAHGNTGRPEDLFDEPTLTSMFRDGPFRGNMVEVLSQPKTNSFTGIAPYDGSTPSSATSAEGGVYYGNRTGITGQAQQGVTEGEWDGVLRTTTSSDGGVLARFGSYDWGGVGRDQFVDMRDRLPQSIGGSASLANILAGNLSGGRSPSHLIGGGHSVEAAVGRPAMQFVDGIVDGVSAAARSTGLAPMDHTNRDNGLELSNVAIAGTNRNLDGTHMLGQKNNGKRTRGFGSDIPPE
jgi:hypothetical protein